MRATEQKPVEQSPLVERDVEEPPAGTGELRLKVSACAACRTDADFRDLPAKMDSAILFAPVGNLVPPIMEALDRGSVCAIAAFISAKFPRSIIRGTFFGNANCAA